MISSSAAKYFVIFKIIKSQDSSITNIQENINNIYILDKISPKYKNQFRQLIINDSQLTHEIMNRILDQIHDFLLLLTLEPEMTAKQDDFNIFLTINSLDDLLFIFNTNFLNQASEKCYLKSINLLEYFKILNIEYILARLDVSDFLKISLRKSFKYSTWIQYVDYTTNKIFSPKDTSHQFIVHDAIIKFLAYCLFLEVIYLSQSRAMSSLSYLLRSSNGDCLIISMDFELLLWGNIDQTVSLLYQAFNSLLYYVDVQQINSLKNSPFDFYKGIDFSVYCLFLKQNMIISSTPSLDAQSALINKINMIFYRHKSNSEVILIKYLNEILLYWGNYFISTNSSRIFALIDYFIYLKLRAWILRRHPTWGHNRIIQKYFVSSDNIHLRHIDCNNRWIFHTYVNQQLIVLLQLRSLKYINREVI